MHQQELEYPDGHTSRSIYVAMPLVSLGPHVTADASPHLEGANLAIWTTTPWTIPANAAVAVNADLTYAVVQASEVIAVFSASFCALAESDHWLKDVARQNMLQPWLLLTL